MVEELVFVTSNLNKLAEARKIAKQYGINLQGKALEIDEIQSNDPMMVAKAKAEAVYQILNRAIITHDASWSIFALRGFPGAYMHDMVNWFVPEDWLNLMQRYSDRTVEVCENVTYYDGREMKCFQYRQKGVFADAPRGTNGNSLEKVVVLEGNRTIAEHHDVGIENNSITLQAWKDFFDWYQGRRGIT